MLFCYYSVTIFKYFKYLRNNIKKSKRNLKITIPSILRLTCTFSKPLFHTYQITLRYKMTYDILFLFWTVNLLKEFNKYHWVYIKTPKYFVLQKINGCLELKRIYFYDAVFFGGKYGWIVHNLLQYSQLNSEIHWIKPINNS